MSPRVWEPWKYRAVPRQGHTDSIQKPSGRGAFGSGILAQTPIWPGKEGGDDGIWRSYRSQALFIQVSCSYFPIGGDGKANATVQESPLTKDLS